MIETGTLLQDRYLIEKQIGAGGMGAVYLAVDQRFGSYVALKETFYKDEEFGAAFEREARLLNGLHHSALPHVSDYFTENGEYFLVMQYIEGEDLFDSLKSGKQFAVETVLDWTQRLLDALDYLHSQNPPIIHRDIKPQNLKITTRGDIILLDFGLAKHKSEDSTTQSVFGYSRRYSPLEQIQGIGTDARSDIFSLAATVYHLLTNEPPIDALTRAAEIVAGKSDPLKKADEIKSEIPSSAAAVLNKALALNSAARFDSARAMSAALKNPPAVDTEQVSKAALTEFADESADQDFPALTAFAAGGGIAENEINTPVEENFKPRIIVADNHAEQSFAAGQDDLTDVPTRVSPAALRKSRVPFAAGFILLVCAGLSAAYFIGKTDATAPPASIEVSREAETPPSNANNAEINSALPSSVAPAEETMSVSTAQDSEVKKASAKAEKTEKFSAPLKRETARQNAVVTAPQPEESRNNGTTRERIVEDSRSVAGNAADANEQRRQKKLRRREQRRNEPILEMSEDEWRDYQRRQQQRNGRGRPFPY